MEPFSAPAATLAHEAIERHVDAAAALIGLPIAAEHRPGVLRYFALAAGMAAQVNALKLDMHDEPASQFSPVSPGDLPGGEPSAWPVAGGRTEPPR